MVKRKLSGCAATSAAERAKRMQTTHPSVRESPSRAASPRGGSAGTGGATSGPRAASPRHSGSASMRTLAQQKKRQGKGKESALRTAVSPPSAQTSMRLEVDVERYIQGLMCSCFPRCGWVCSDCSCLGDPCTSRVELREIALSCPGAAQVHASLRQGPRPRA